MGGGAQRLELELPPVPEAARVARAAVDRVAATLAGDVGFRARLAASELVTNSVTHSTDVTTRIRLAVDETAAGVRVEVRDGGEAFDPAVRDVTERSTSGRGLRLVDALVDRWGVAPADGNLVWFEIDRPAGGHRRAPRFPARGDARASGWAEGHADEAALAAAALSHAALRVREGWCQGAAAIDRTGAAVEPESPTAVAWSLLGALVVAEGESPSAARLQALGTAMTILAVLLDGPSLAAWNDAPGRTQREVIALLERARMRLRPPVAR